ncbi:hypothetical protein V502_05421 [Pseudogymnoascus sp. VKM F-4520 (FW-2644)]|nr:hypothetical protein V502_05421 [Pseudogymnoascus sp. VKM F-4520 (FW-2644)]
MARTPARHEDLSSPGQIPIQASPRPPPAVDGPRHRVAQPTRHQRPRKPTATQSSHHPPPPSHRDRAVSSHRFRGRGTCARPRHGASGLTGDVCGETAAGWVVGWGAVVGAAAAGAQLARSAAAFDLRPRPRQGVSRGGGRARRTLGETAMEGTDERGPLSLHRFLHPPTAERRASH